MAEQADFASPDDDHHGHSPLVDAILQPLATKIDAHLIPSIMTNTSQCGWKTINVRAVSQKREPESRTPPPSQPVAWSQARPLSVCDAQLRCVRAVCTKKPGVLLNSCIALTMCTSLASRF